MRLRGLAIVGRKCRPRRIVVTWHKVDSYAEHYGIRLGDDGLRIYVDNQAGRLVLWRYYPDEGSMVTAVLRFLIQNI